MPLCTGDGIDPVPVAVAVVIVGDGVNPIEG